MVSSRRDVLKAGVVAPALIGLPACRSAASCDVPDAAGAGPLKARAEERGLLFGTAVDRETLEHDARYAEAVIAECSLVTPENSMKWERLQPTPDRYDFNNADWLVAFAENNGLRVHGHTLVWNKQLPGWLEDRTDKSNAEALLLDHIETVVGRYAGRLRSWDVVNEVVEVSDGRGDGLRLTPWLRHLGPGYIDVAFHAAAEADPDAVLVYNDFGLEYDERWFEERRGYVLDLLTGMVARGVPVDAFGIQSHLSGDRPTDFAHFARFLDEVADLGLDIMVTELDVRDHELPADETARDCEVAATYKAYLDVLLDQPTLRSIAVWGLSDRYSWLHEFEPRADGNPVRPLPFDHDMQRKPAWHAIANALSE